MNSEKLFAEILADTLKSARRQGNVLAKSAIDDAFAYLQLDDAKRQQVYQYFREHKVTVLEEGKEAPVKADAQGAHTYASGLSLAEREALFASVLREEKEAQMRLIEAYLPMVEDIARLYEEQGVLRDDLIGEGNVALVEGVAMLSACETLEEAEHALSGFVMNAMEGLIHRTMQDKADDEKTLARINETAEKAIELAQEYHRNLTIEEFLDETGFSEDELESVLRLTGWQMEGLELKP